MDAVTWDRQPWWAQRIYLAGLMEEQPWDRGGCAMAERKGGGKPLPTFEADDKEPEPDRMASAGELRQSGFNVQRG